jgi:DNA-binding LacI/PurR family transcriptional regulator
MPRFSSTASRGEGDPATSNTRLQMADIARLANVSISTVSRALSNHPRIGKETRERVLELARSLNYSINAGAQLIKGKSMRTVSVVFPFHPTQRQHFQDPFFMTLVGFIGDALIERGYSLLLNCVDAGRREAMTQAYDTGQAVGTIILGQEDTHDIFNRMALQRLPFVVWGARMPDQLYKTVGSDNRMGGRLAARHLLAAGARRILFIGEPTLLEAGQRHAGYVDAHEELGFVPDPGLLLRTPMLIGDVEAYLGALSGPTLPFDAIFAASDVLALTAINCLARRGVRVPEDILVCGYDDVAVAANSRPSLTTVKQDIARGGRDLVSVLFAQIEGQACDSSFMPSELIARESTRRQ